MRAAVPLVLILCWLCAAPDATAKHHPCWPKGSKSEARDARGRVYSVNAGYGYRSYFVCLYRIGRAWPLADNAHGVDNAVVRIEIESPYVAYVLGAYSSQGSQEGLDRINMRTGRIRHLDVFPFEDCCPPWVVLRRFLLTDLGAVVWARDVDDESLRTTEIKKLDADGKAKLDTGMDIDASSLHLSRSGHRAYWKNAGEQRSARLR